MERCNTLAAAYAARCNAGDRTAGGTKREEARAEARVDARGSVPPVHVGLDESVLLAALRRSAGPCDRVFASRLAFGLGNESGL
jgi:hypothetical protein